MGRRLTAGPESEADMYDQPTPPTLPAGPGQDAVDSRSRSRRLAGGRARRTRLVLLLLVLVAALGVYAAAYAAPDDRLPRETLIDGIDVGRTGQRVAVRRAAEDSEFTTYYPHAGYRNVNIGRAAEPGRRHGARPGGGLQPQRDRR